MEDESARSPQALSAGKAPGTLQIPADAAPTAISVIRYSPESHQRNDGVAAGDLAKLVAGGDDVVWVDVSGCAGVEVFQALIDGFGIPYLAVEDHLNAPQRPKVEPYGPARFILLRPIQTPGTTEMDQISVFFSGRVVFTFQHRSGDCFDPLRKRLLAPGSQLRQRGADYLAYRLVDSIVDTFFPELDRLVSSFEALEADAIERADAKLLRRLHELKTELRILERAILPTRDAVGSLTRDEAAFAPATRPYLRDVHDHTQQLVEQIHLLSALATDVGDLVIGTLDVSLNQVMKVLAAVTFVFMPLNFVTSWYGMNFEHMPELKWWWAYPLLLVLLVSAGVAMILWLRRRGWADIDERR